MEGMLFVQPSPKLENHASTQLQLSQTIGGISFQKISEVQERNTFSKDFFLLVQTDEVNLENYHLLRSFEYEKYTLCKGFNWIKIFKLLKKSYFKFKKKCCRKQLIIIYIFSQVRKFFGKNRGGGHQQQQQQQQQQRPMSRHMVPRPFGLAFLSCFEELDRELCEPQIRAFMEQQVRYPATSMIYH